MLAGYWDGRWVRQLAGHWGDGGGVWSVVGPPLKFSVRFQILVEIFGVIFPVDKSENLWAMTVRSWLGVR